MAKKKKIPEKYQPCIDARQRYDLSHAHIQMARELGLNPKKFGGLTDTKQEPWKLPLPEYIEELYIEQFKKNRPQNVRPIEQMVRDYRRKKQERKIRRIEGKNTDPSGEGEERQQQWFCILSSLCEIFPVDFLLRSSPRFPSKWMTSWLH